MTFYDDELTPEELAAIRRRTFVRRVIVIVVVIAMIATLVVPVIVRVVRQPTEPEGILAVQPLAASNRMIV